MRNRNIGRRKYLKLKEKKKMLIYNNVSPYFNGAGTATPTCLLELLTRGLSMVKENTIHLNQKVISEI